MNTFHSHLCDTSTWYRKWHEHRSAGMYHWTIFLLFALFASLSILKNIDIAYSDTGPQAAAQAVLAGSQGGNHRPTWAGVPQGPAQDHILVKFKNGVSSDKKDGILNNHGMSVINEIKQIGLKIVSIPQDLSPEEAAQDLMYDNGSDVAYAEPDQAIPASFIPNDPYYTSEWHLPVISAPQAWDVQQGKPSVTVAILDTGVDCTHPDLATHCVPGWNVYDNTSNTADVYGHGTAVAGIAAAVGNNAVGVSGVAPQVSIMPVRVSDAAGYGYISTFASGLTYAADHGARVANISYQATGYSTVDSAAQYFMNKGGVVTVAAGNYGTVDTTPNDPYLITVSATTIGNGIASWSNTGSDIVLAAPGDGIYTTTNGGGYASGTGTSFSAPIVAGVAALVISQNPSLTGSQVAQVLKSNADDLGPVGWDPGYGYGLVDAYKAVVAAGSTTADTTPPTVPSGLTASVNSNGAVYLSWNASTDNVGVTGYVITRNGTVLATAGGTSYIDASVAGATTYTYSVQATDAANNLSASSNSVTVTTPAPPVAVTSFRIVTKTGTTANIAWNTNISSTGILIYGTAANALTMSVADTNTGTSHGVTLSGLKTASTYYYQIRAVSLDNSTSANTPVSTFKTARK